MADQPRTESRGWCRNATIAAHTAAAGVVAEALAAHMAAYQPADDGSLGLPAGTTSHHLRHHYASVLLAAGESVVAMAGRLGHENGTLVLKTYGHLMPDMEDRTRRAHRRRVDR